MTQEIASTVTADQINQMFFDLEAEGKHLIQQFQHQSEGFCQRVIRLGDSLLLKKHEVGHGKWMQWIAENLLFSDSTAQIYMRLAKANSQQSRNFSFDSIRLAIKELTSAEQVQPQQQDMFKAPAIGLGVSWVGKATERFFAKAGKTEAWDEVAKRDLKFLLDGVITLAKKVGVDIHGHRSAVTLEAETVGHGVPPG